MIGSAYVDVDGVSGGIDGLSSLSSEFVSSVELSDAGVDWGRRLRSIHQDGIHSSIPSSLIRHAQPFCRKWVW